jgi:hypothetical protein
VQFSPFYYMALESLDKWITHSSSNVRQQNALQVKDDVYSCINEFSFILRTI